MPKIYPLRHSCCYHYEKGEKPALEALEATKGTVIERDLTSSEIVFCIGGEFILSHGKIVDKKIPTGKIMFFPPGVHIKAVISQDAHLIIARPKGIIQLCECFSIQHFYEKKETTTEKFHMLDINEKIRRYIEDFVETVNDGTKCHYYSEIKIKEFFFLLRNYYPKEELNDFFSPLQGNDAQFMDLMYQNYRQVKSVAELAGLSRYSISGFKKQFQRVFGTSPSFWLRDRKAAFIFQDLNGSPLTIKELADKYDFSSVSSFSTFCLNNFGLPPGKIRNGKIGELCAGKSIPE